MLPFLCWKHCPVVVMGPRLRTLTETPFVPTPITALAPPAVDLESVRMDGESHFGQRDTSTEDGIRTWLGIVPESEERERNSLISVSGYSFHYDQNMKAHTLTQRGEKSLLLTNLCINNNNDDEYASNSLDEQKLLLARESKV